MGTHAQGRDFLLIRPRDRWLRDGGGSHFTGRAASGAMDRSTRRRLGALLLLYAGASLVHFVHNAEFLADYPHLPASWSRAQVYLAWVGLTGVGVLGWLSLARGWTRIGLVLLAVYAALGIASLGHYALAPLAAHTIAMNATILTEVAAAALVLLQVLRLLAQRLIQHAVPG